MTDDSLSLDSSHVSHLRLAIHRFLLHAARTKATKCLLSASVPDKVIRAMAKSRPRKKEVSRKPSKETAFPFLDMKLQSIALVVIGLVLYANSFTNLYALDDGIVIQKNNYVQEGLRGIPKILTTDVYESFYSQMNTDQQLSGGRYRPLSVLTFAIEQQLFGSNEKVKPEGDVAFIRHFVNVALFIGSVILLLQFLRESVLTESPHAAFLASLVFLIHPVHTEVIANVKSRDEILSFLFIVLTFIAVFRYRKTKRALELVFGLLFYFLALLSKEYGITLIVLIPLLLFVVNREALGTCLKAVLPFAAVALVYLWLRYEVVGLGSTQGNVDVLNNPYMFATEPEKWATRIEVLGRYLKLLFIPYPLSSDYSYKAIPYTHFDDPRVWCSIGFHLVLVGATVILFVRRNILAFAFAFYLLHLLLVSNLVVDIGATMGERLIYHSSFGFALAIAVLLGWGMGKFIEGRHQTLLTIALSALLLVPCAAIVIPRNAQWKSDASLFIADARTVPQSALVNGNAGKAYLDLSERPENKAEAIELTKKSIPFSEKAIGIHKEYLNGYLNLGVAYFKLGEYEKAEAYWNRGQEIYPDHPYLKQDFRVLGHVYYDQAMALGSENTPEAIRLLEKATRADPENPDVWYNLGRAYSRANEAAKARVAWSRTLQLKPDYKEAEQAMSSLPAP